MVEFQAQVAGHGTGTQAAFKELLKLPDWKLAAQLANVRPILLVPASWWSQCIQSAVPEFENAEWWQKPVAEMQYVECGKCGETKELPKFSRGQKGIGG